MGYYDNVVLSAVSHLFSLFSIVGCPSYLYKHEENYLITLRGLLVSKYAGVRNWQQNQQ